MTIVTTLLLGVIYPLAITGIAQVAFPDKANGQLIERDGKVDRLANHRPGVFVARLFPTAAVGGRHRATTRRTLPARSSDRRTRSSSTTSRPTSRQRARRIRTRRSPSIWSPPPPRDSTRTSRRQPPTSRFRAWRASAGCRRADVRALVAAHTEGRQLGFLGEPRVNVLELNLALDEEHRNAR